MTQIEIKETGRTEEIIVIDPKTGIDWSADLIGNTDPEIEGYNDDGGMIMTQENFNWWENYCNEYEKADNLVNDFFNDLKEDCWNKFETGNPEDAYQKSDNLEAKYHDYICGIEFNDIPQAMLRFIKEN